MDVWKWAMALSVSLQRAGRLYFVCFLCSQFLIIPMLLLLLLCVISDVVERVIRFTTRRIHQAQVGDGIDLFQQQRIVQL